MINLKILKMLLSQKDRNRIFLGILIGGIVQMICHQYIKNHPERFEEERKDSNEIIIDNKTYKFPPRGGLRIELLFRIINFLAHNGFAVGILTSLGVVALTKIPLDAVSTSLRQASIQSFAELGLKRFIMVDGEKINLKECDQDLECLFIVLKDTTLPFGQKEDLTWSILMEYLNLKKPDKVFKFMLCMSFILYIFSHQDTASLDIILKNLIKAVKEGKISKSIVRIIIRRIMKNNVPVDPELLKLINFKDI